MPLSVCTACLQLLCFLLYPLQQQRWKRTECFRWGHAFSYIKGFIDFSAIYWLSSIFCLLSFVYCYVPGVVSAAIHFEVIELEPSSGTQSTICLCLYELCPLTVCLQHSMRPSSGTFAFSQADGSCSQPFSCAYWASSHLHMCCTSSSLALPSARYKSLRWCHIIEHHWGEVCPYWRSLYCTLWTFCLMAIAMTSLSSFLQIFD